MQNRTLFSAISLTRGHKHVVNTTLIMGSYGYWVQVLSSPYRIRLCPSQLQQKLGWIADKWADKHAVWSWTSRRIVFLPQFSLSAHAMSHSIFQKHHQQQLSSLLESSCGFCWQIGFFGRVEEPTETAKTEKKNEDIDCDTDMCEHWCCVYCSTKGDSPMRGKFFCPLNHWRQSIQ